MNGDTICVLWSDADGDVVCVMMVWCRWAYVHCGTKLVPQHMRIQIKCTSRDLAWLAWLAFVPWHTDTHLHYTIIAHTVSPSAIVVWCTYGIPVCAPSFPMHIWHPHPHHNHGTYGVPICNWSQCTSSFPVKKMVAKSHADCHRFKTQPNFEALNLPHHQ